MSEGLFPVISLATHHNPSAKSKSCIDNIFTNRVETINQSGVVVNFGTAQSPIFSTSKLKYDLNPFRKKKITHYYNFSNKNTDCFVRKLEENYKSLMCSDHPTHPTSLLSLTSTRNTCSTKENSKEFN